jgi:hypothetical protein
MLGGAWSGWRVGEDAHRECRKVFARGDRRVVDKKIKGPGPCAVVHGSLGAVVVDDEEEVFGFPATQPDLPGRLPWIAVASANDASGLFGNQEAKRGGAHGVLLGLPAKVKESGSGERNQFDDKSGRFFHRPAGCRGENWRRYSDRLSPFIF